MYNYFLTLVRGRAHDQADRLRDATALTILNQQIRDCAQAIRGARRAVAVAIAQNERERAQHAATKNRLADLDLRARAALDKGEDDLAREAAEAIAILEDELLASEKAQASFAREIARLKGIVRSAEARLHDLQRGQRIAAANDKTQKLRSSSIAMEATDLVSLKDAEETLRRLQARQEHIDQVAEALDDMDGAADPSSLTERLAEAGCGAPLRTRAADVLARLKADRITCDGLARAGNS